MSHGNPLTNIRWQLRLGNSAVEEAWRVLRYFSDERVPLCEVYCLSFYWSVLGFRLRRFNRSTREDYDKIDVGMSVRRPFSWLILGRTHSPDTEVPLAECCCFYAQSGLSEKGIWRFWLNYTSQWLLHVCSAGFRHITNRPGANFRWSLTCKLSLVITCEHVCYGGIAVVASPQAHNKVTL